MVSTAQEGLGPIDVLINNAGVFPRVPFLEMTERDWDHVLDVSLDQNRAPTTSAYVIGDILGSSLVIEPIDRDVQRHVPNQPSSRYVIKNTR
jgi:NAD(P)-dependent dehydrogenase (short-subunit alcohol dehydrogenase family)